MSVSSRVTNGLLQSFTDTEMGVEQSADFDDVINTTFSDNYPTLPEGFEAPDEYAAEVRETLGFDPETSEESSSGG